MKKILITGASSYIGESFENWLKKYHNQYIINTIDLIDDKWSLKSFSKYDVLFHVAGIAHIKETKENSDLYYKVNRDLTYKIAEKAKLEGVRHFIYLSSMSVYGIENGEIDENSMLIPKSNYGKSKLEAEKLILSLEDTSFTVSILRPPIVYGNNCKGNYPKLSKLAVSLPLFPDITNQRSMIYIDNLCEFVRLLVDSGESGIFFPQNKEYVNTSQLVKLISKVHGKNIILTKLFNFFLYLALNRIGIVKKIFGNLTYSKSLTSNELNYCVVDFEQSVKLSEGITDI